MKIDFNDNPLIVNLPLGAGYVNEKGEIFTIDVIRIDFSILDPKADKVEIFEVAIDDNYFITQDFKITDDHTLAGKFTRFAESNGHKKEYETIYDRSMMVAAAVLKGTIKLLPELEAKIFMVLDYLECQSCHKIFEEKKVEDLENDGDTHGTCPTCKLSRVFIPCTKDGKYKEN